MVNCINCSHILECEYANEDVKECIYFDNPNRKLPKGEKK